MGIRLDREGLENINRCVHGITIFSIHKIYREVDYWNYGRSRRGQYSDSSSTEGRSDDSNSSATSSSETGGEKK
jgi:hypothetical protein